MREGKVGAAFLDKKKVKKIVGTTADVTAGAAGGVVRLSLKIIISILLVFICTGLLFVCIFAYYVKTTLDPRMETKLEDYKVNLSTTIWYTDAEGVAQELVTLDSDEDRIWVEYENIPEDMEHALVAIEDKRFYEHKGVDWYRTAGAMVNMFFAMNNEFGGSSITQQLIKNVTGEDQGLVMRKLVEIFQALELEKTYTKPEIIEWYLNMVYFGQGSYGVQTAAQTYFGKDVWDLSLAECAAIVGITNNPSRYDPFRDAMIYLEEYDMEKSCREWNKFRQEIILYEMYDQGYITYEEYRAAVEEELVFVRAENEGYTMEIYSYYEEIVIADVKADLMAELSISEKAANDLIYYGGLQIYCCLDPEIQAVVDSVYENLEGLPKPYYAASQQLQSAIVIVDPYTGEIKAMSGGVGQKNTNFGFNRITAQRSPGSSIKPLSVYGPALEHGLISQNTLVNDSPDIQLSGTNWYTTNSPNRYDNIITIRYALQQSKNTVAAQIIDKLTPQEAYDYMVEKLGFVNLVEQDRNYSPMALGSLTYGVTVREMAQAYTSFVNDGIFTYARSYSKVLGPTGEVILDNKADSHVAFSQNTAANICDMLENAVDNGTGGSADFAGMSVAGKTGTGSFVVDRYFVGFTPYYVAAVWTGYDTPETMNFYSNPAAQIWKAVMQPIHEGLEYKEFDMPVIGQPTNIFGDLTEELEEQNNPKPTPTPTPEPEEGQEATQPEQPESGEAEGEVSPEAPEQEGTGEASPDPTEPVGGEE